MDVSTLEGVGSNRSKLLNDMGIYTITDLINYFPRNHDDRSEIKTISMLSPGTTNTIRGVIATDGENIIFKPGSPVMTKFILQDKTGVLELVWFGQPYLKQYFKKNQEYLFTGKVKEAFGRVYRLQMESPDYENIGEIDEMLSAGRIVPIYALPKGISQKMFRRWIKSALDMVANLSDLPEESKKTNESKEVADPLLAIIRKGDKSVAPLCTRASAIRNIHFPESDTHFHEARRRLVFEELFFMQLALLQIKGVSCPGIVMATNRAKLSKCLEPFLLRLPFSLTATQQAVLNELAYDLQSGKRMNRLVQGDVGSGKTVVAAATAFLVMSCGYQAAIMAPTEILAQQHFVQFSQLLPEFTTVLLTGSIKRKTEVLEAIREGRAQMVVGTHALIQNSVMFQNLGLVITDEQHRFGVNQRAALSNKGKKIGDIDNIEAIGKASKELLPHMMIMTATPIPRTLGLILYGDMDISIIDALPPGRKEIKTYYVNGTYRQRLVAFMRKQVEEGRQVYVICPAIEESEESAESTKAVNTVKEYAIQLQKRLPDISIACLHGKLKSQEKDSIMTAFARNELHIVVSTTVIEVGVDVPNATLIIIENADRFGLSQLHQLRGRVGRGKFQSYCVLVTDTKNPQTLQRMRAMEQNSDGFALSELDLQLRGPGDFFGTQQHGLPAFTIANLYRDRHILKESQEAAFAVHEGTPLTKEEQAILDSRVIDVFPIL